MLVKKPPELKIDIGCGPNKQKGHIGLDRIKFDGVDHVLELGYDPWPFKNETVDEAYTSHFVEHLDSVERVFFVNELYRVLKAEAKCKLIVPHWGGSRAYGDPTHKWPPMGEAWFYYLSREWRAKNAPHTDREHWIHGFACNFEATWSYTLSPVLASRNLEYQQFAVNNYREAIGDIIATLTKR